MKVFALLGLSVMLAVPAQDVLRPDADGFIHDWLVVAPFAINGESGMAEIDREFFAGDAAVKPRAKDVVRMGNSFYTWEPHHTTDYLIDFRESFGSALSEYVAAYAATYVVAPEEMRVTLAMGSNDQGKVWLNGKEVAKSTDPRGLERDATKAEVTLLKGKNTLLFKVINEVNSWQGCIRFLRGAAPAAGLTLSLTPD